MYPRSFQGRELLPRWIEVPNALVLPTRLDDASLSFGGAVYDQHGVLVPESLRPAALGHWVPSASVTVSRPMLGTARRIPRAIFGGHLFTIYGHFLFETLGTAWAAGKVPPWKVVFLGFAHDPASASMKNGLARFMPVLSAAGWADRPVTILSEPIQVDRLFVPERLTVYEPPWGTAAIHPAMGEVFARLRAAWPAGDRAVVVAQRPKGHSREHPEEQALYRLLSEAGHMLIDGASLGMEEQIRAFRRAKAIVGFSGSSLHNSVFCDPGVPVIEITDARSAVNPEKRNRTQAAICELLRQPYSIVDGCGTGEASVLEPRPARDILAELSDELDRTSIPRRPRTAGLADIARRWRR